MSFLLATLLLSSTPAAEAGAPNPPSTEVPAAKPKKEKRICRADPATTGSLIPNRVCHTREEWQKLAGEAAAGESEGK